MKILLADDHLLFRDGLKLVLQKFEPDIEVVEANTYGDAVGAVQSEEAIDLVLLDLKMPGMNGFDGLRDMCSRVAPAVPVVIISGDYSRRDIAESFKQGAAGFIPKTLGARAMFSAINLVLSGERYVPSLAFIQDEVAPADPSTASVVPSRSAVFPDLTSRERDVLKLLINGFTNQQIADRLGIKEVSVRARLTGIFRKLGVTSRTQAAGLAIREGFGE